MTDEPKRVFCMNCRHLSGIIVMNGLVLDQFFGERCNASTEVDPITGGPPVVQIRARERNKNCDCALFEPRTAEQLAESERLQRDNEQRRAEADERRKQQDADFERDLARQNRPWWRFWR